MQVTLTKKEKIAGMIISAFVIAGVMIYTGDKYRPVTVAKDVARYASARMDQQVHEATAEQIVPAAHVAKTKKAGHLSPVESEHTVAKGETVYSISRKYGADPKAVCELNGLGKECTIHPGQHLTMARK